MNAINCTVPHEYELSIRVSELGEDVAQLVHQFPARQHRQADLDPEHLGIYVYV